MSGQPTVRVLGIAGSLRAGSYNRLLLRAAVELAPPEMAITVFERLGEIPPYNQDVEDRGDPESVAALKEAIRSADALLIATPEYNFGIPGVLKNAIDWVSRPSATTPLRGKPAAILGATPGNGGTIRAQTALRQVLLFPETQVLLAPQFLLSQARQKFDGQGRLTDEKTRAALSNLLAALAAWTKRLGPGHAA